MSGHQKKRPYAGSHLQPSITTFFAPACQSSSAQPNYSISQQTAAPTPALPPKVQADLLSVGMRVRKSVPEGYKIHSQSSFSVYSDASSAPSTPMEHQRAEARLGGNMNVVKCNRPRARELTPFCGLLKIGGMAQQMYSPGGDSPEDDCMDDVPALSQGSTISNTSISSPGGERKRRMDFDEEDREDASFEFSFSPRFTLGSGFMGDRVIAVPRQRKYKNVKTNVGIFGQENMDSDTDFEEADFLDYGMLGEVEMGGV